MRTSIKKNPRGGFIVTNLHGEKFKVLSKRRANEIADASKRLAIKRRKRRCK